MPENYSPALNANVNPWFSGKTSSFNALRELTAPFDPAGLYAGAVPGAWFEPSLTTCFTGTAPFKPASYGDPVSLVLDQSEELQFGPDQTSEVMPLVFPNQGTIAIKDGNSYIIERTAGNVQNSYIEFSAPGWHEVVFEIEDIGGGTQADMRVNAAEGQSIVYYGVGTHRRITHSYGWVRWLAPQGTRIKVTVISIRAIYGNHALQPVVSKQPILARSPRTARRNILVGTSFSGSIWRTHQSILTPLAGGVAKLVGTGNSEQNVKQTLPVTAGDSFHCKVEVKAAELSTITIIVSSAVWPSGGGASMRVNLVDGEVEYVGGRFESYSVTDVGDGWFSIKWSFIAGVTGSGGNAYWIDLRQANYVPNAGVFLRRPQVDRGLEDSPYQSVSSDYDITESGVPSYTYLSFDGVDDFMATNAISFADTDEMAVFAGAEKTGVSGNVIVAELGTSGYDAYSDRPIDPVATDDHFFFTSNDIGDVFSNTWNAGVAVLSATSDISENVSTLRVGGEVAAVDNGDQGDGNYATYPLYIGARAGTSMFFKGNIHSLLVVGSKTDDDTTVKMEERVEARTGEQ